MKEIIESIDKDIKRCEDVLKSNDYLEIVIAIEELNDKYEKNAELINNIEQNVVWNYSKKDLQKIEDSLKKYKEELLKEEKEKSINTKIQELKEYVEYNNISDKDNIIKAINNIEDVKNKDITLDEKYEEIKPYFIFIQNLERITAMKFLEIIVFLE